MTQPTDLELIPNQDKYANATFREKGEYDSFWNALLESVKDDLEKIAAARKESEDQAKRRWFR